jgi:hypothetical protein
MNSFNHLVLGKANIRRTNWLIQEYLTQYKAKWSKPRGKPRKAQSFTYKIFELTMVSSANFLCKILCLSWLLFMLTSYFTWYEAS